MNKFALITAAIALSLSAASIAVTTVKLPSGEIVSSIGDRDQPTSKGLIFVRMPRSCGGC